MASVDRSEKREQGSVMVVIGLGVLLADLLVIFFASASFRTGQKPVFLTIILALAVIGLALVISGRRRRGRAT